MNKEKLKEDALRRHNAALRQMHDHALTELQRLDKGMPPRFSIRSVALELNRTTIVLETVLDICEE